MEIIMNKNQDPTSILKLEKLMFDKIEFKRIGESTQSELELNIQSNIAVKQDPESYKVSLTLIGNKPDEYMFEICLIGIFTFKSDEVITEEAKLSLISKNTIAILMPYMRSEVSLLTAQPGLNCVVLPPFNINKILEENSD